MALGLDKGRGESDKGKRIVAVIGDSTFLHMGMQGLLDITYNRGNVTVLLLDNRAVGMTGGQNNPGTGRDIHGNEAPRVDFAKLAEALGVKPERIRVRRSLRAADAVQGAARRNQDRRALGHHHQPPLRADRGLREARSPTR
ncbi:MAG: thiamine pyrophosphate-dependent enzyme [Comamonadaceae bacterium]|nr:thiamine pyrophosphate-dependent enzyme [Comamonadaceae bacterium]